MQDFRVKHFQIITKIFDHIPSCRKVRDNAAMKFAIKLIALQETILLVEQLLFIVKSEGKSDESICGSQIVVMEIRIEL